MKALLLHIYFYLFISLVAGQTQFADLGSPVISNFSHKEYGEHEQNWAATQDHRGVMYFGNTHGILEYDGVTWRFIPTTTPDIVRSLSVDSTGRIYVGGHGYFGYLRPDSIGKMEFISLSDKLESEDKNFRDVWKTYSVSKKTYFQTKSALYQWTGNKIKLWKPEKLFHLSYIVSDTLYIRQFDVGLMHMIGDSLQLIRNGDFYADKRIYAMMSLDGGRILIGTRNHGFFIYDGHSSVPFYTDADKFLFENKLYGGKALPGHLYALATLNGGVAIINEKGRLIKILDRELGINDNKVWNMYFDNQGGLWLALDNGLSRVQFPAPLTFFSEQSGLIGTAEFITKYENRIYVSSHQGLYALNTTHGKSINAGFENMFGITSQIWGLLSTGNSILFSVNGVGIYEVTGKQKKLISTYVPYSLARSKINPDILYLGLPDGFAFLQRKGKNWLDLGKIELENGPIRYIVETKQGDLWLGTSKMEICKFNYSSRAARKDSLLYPQIEYFDHKNGLPESVQYYVFSFRDKVLFGTSKGLYRFSESHHRFVPDSSFGGNFDQENRSIQRLVEDRNGNVWMATANENRFELGFVLQENNGSYHWNYTPFLPLQKSVIYAIYPDPFNQGIFWFGGSDGVIRYDMNMTKDYSFRYEALVRNIYINGDSLIFAGYSSPGTGKTDSYKLPQMVYQYNAMRFEYAAPSFDDHKANLYQHYLDGFDKKWSGWTAETQAIYTNIPEGKYMFRVRAKNIYDQISVEGNYGFEIMPPWYRTWIAFSVYGIFIFGAIISLIRLRSYQLESEKRELENIVLDRTEEIRIKNIQLNEQSEKLREMNSLKSRFYANISHEFRTPLTLIIGPTEEMLRKSNKGKAQKAHRLILRNARRLLKLINQMLDLSKIEDGSMKLQATQQNLSSFLKTIVNMFSSLAESRHIHLQYLEPQEEYLAYFDRDKMENILYNLITNAFKFTPQEGHISITVNKYKTDPDKYPEGAVEVSVHDSGVGISPEQLPYIFDRFSQGDVSYIDSFGGSGIGLALTKELIELHHGEINVVSEPEHGTEFDIILPLGKAHLHSTEIMEKVSTESEPGTLPDMDLTDFNLKTEHRSAKMINKSTEDKPLVLIIEDNAELRDHIRTHLDANYQVIEADNGREGLEKAREQLPDLIVSDIMMPEMDGNELCDRIKKDPLTSYIPVILLTAKSTDEAKMEGLKTGADDFLTKPFKTGELAIRIKNMITSRQTIREKFKKEFLIEPSDIFADSMDDVFIKQMRDIIEEKMNDPTFSADVLQNELALSRRQFYRKILALTGQTPGQFIRAIRLKRAMQLIGQKSGTISQIAFEVGFSNISYFAKCFRTQFGKLPSEI